MSSFISHVLPCRRQEPAATELTAGEICKILSNPRRRQIVQYLQNIDGAATAGELAEWIASEEQDKTVQDVTSGERKAVYVSLYQTHLPLMNEMDIVDYDERAKMVALRVTASILEPYLDQSVEEGYRRLTSIGTLGSAVIVSLGVLQFGLFGLVPVSVWILLGIVCLISMVTLDVYAFRQRTPPLPQLSSGG